MGDEKSRNANPFLPRRADHVSSKQIVDFFANHAKSAPIKERGHHLIIGASGAGKTTAFRYFTLRDQLDSGKIIDIDPAFIGVYISLKENIEAWKRKPLTEGLNFFYQNYLNLSIGYKIIDAINLCHINSLFEIDRDFNKYINLFNKLLKTERLLSSYDNIEEIIDEEKRHILEYVNTIADPRIPDFKGNFSTSIITFIPFLCQGIIQNSPYLQKHLIPFYIFLDYYDELQAWQQKIVNTLIQRPSDSYFIKLGSRPFGVYDYTNVSGRSILDSLEGRIILQYFREELDHFKDVLLEIVGRRLGWQLPPGRALIDELLPTEDPLVTATRIIPGLKMDDQYDLFGQNAQKGESIISMKLENIARYFKEDKRRIKCCLYQGFDRLAEISDGNIGIFMEICASAWQNTIHERTKRELGNVLSPVCQVNAIWNYSTFLSKEVEVSSSDGPFILNLIGKVSETQRSKASLGRNRNYTSCNTEILDINRLSVESIEKLKKAFQTGILLPTSIEGYQEICSKFNLSAFYLLSEGLIDLEYPTSYLQAETVDNWLTNLPAVLTRPIIKKKKPREQQKHIGFLSVSFRNEEPAETAHKTFLQLFNTAPLKINCTDAERFGEPGSPNLLEKIRNFINNNSTFCIAEVSNLTPNTMLELGVIKGQNRLFWTLAHSDNILKLPEWIGGLQLHLYNFDASDKDKYIDNVIRNHILSPLQGLYKKNFCPMWHGSTYCPYPTSKDQTTIYVSYPEEEDIWKRAISEIKKTLTNLPARLITNNDIRYQLPGTPSIVCVWCYAVRFAGIVFVDTTPFSKEEKGPDNKIEGDPTRCFILGLSFGQRERKGTLSVHLVKKGNGRNITLWKGYPSYEWSTIDELVEKIRQEVQGKLANLGKINGAK